MTSQESREPITSHASKLEIAKSTYARDGYAYLEALDWENYWDASNTAVRYGHQYRVFSETRPDGSCIYHLFVKARDDRSFDERLTDVRREARGAIQG